MKANRAWVFFRIRSGCRASGEERAILKSYYGSGAFIVKAKDTVNRYLWLLCG